MSTVCISCSFDGSLSQMTFMTITFFHITLFHNYVTISLFCFFYNSFLVLSLDHVFYVHYYSTFPIHFTYAIMK